MIRRALTFAAKMAVGTLAILATAILIGLVVVLDLDSAVRRVAMPSRTGDQGQGHPVLFGFSPALVYAPHPDGGGYPIGFLERAYLTLGCTDPTAVLHLCSGSMRIGVTVDIRPEMEPQIVADCRNVPLPDESFDWIMADPPYLDRLALLPPTEPK